MRRELCLLLVVAALSACGKEPPPPAPKVATPPPAADTGRAETRALNNLDGVGYNGEAIRNKVDGAMNATDDYNKHMQEQADQ